MSSQLGLDALPGFEDDMAALPTQELRIMTVGLLVEVARGTLTGRSLDVRVSTGDLSDCFKLYFDTDTKQKPRFRLVYRIEDGRVKAVQAVSVGERKGLAAYVAAAERLGRTSG